MASSATTVEPTKEQPMFPSAQPDLMGQLAKERAASLRADAERYRKGRPIVARWRPARFVEPAADRSRVIPVPEPIQTPRTNRAA
jgi:hypothetical protein